MGRGCCTYRSSLATHPKTVRLAVVTPEYPPHHIGGGGIVVEALTHELIRRHEVRVFSAYDVVRSWHRGRSVVLQAGVGIYRYPTVPVFRGLPYLRSVLPPNPVGAANLGRDLAHWSPDVAHLHGYGYATVDLAALILRRLKVPYVFTVHGLPVTPGQRGFFIR